MVSVISKLKKHILINHAVDTILSLFGNFPTNPTSEARFTHIFTFQYKFTVDERIFYMYYLFRCN